MGHFYCSWNGMFDCHRAEITVMQFTGHSLLVHQSDCTMVFYFVPYCQPSPPTQMEYALPLSLEWHVWWGRESIYNTYIHVYECGYVWVLVCVSNLLYWSFKPTVGVLMYLSAYDFFLLHVLSSCYLWPPVCRLLLFN